MNFPCTSKKLDNNRLMLFDLDLGGHHGSYIRHLIEYWYKDLPGCLEIVVSPEFLHIHTEIAELAFKYQHLNLQLRTITQDEAIALSHGQSRLSRLSRDFQRWRLFCKYATQLQVTHALLMYFDTYELPLALGLNSPCPFSGIYFRPTFHYEEFANYIPSWKNKTQQLRERLTLNRVLRHPQLKTLFCLDPFAVKHFDQFHTKANVIYLPDPVELTCNSKLQSDELRVQLEIEPNRQVFLLFGALDGRKGIYQLLDAIAMLPAELCSKLSLVIVGATSSTERVHIQSKIVTLRQTLPLQIIERYEFVPEEDVMNYFQLAKVVLAPYQRHVGMSGILLYAAAAGKPVLSSNYGLMGEIVQRYHLGLTVDSTVPSGIAEGMIRCLLEQPELLCDKSQMRSLVEQHSPERYASIIFSTFRTNSTQSINN